MAANPLTSTLAALLENAANAALNLDAATRQELAELEGHILLLALTTLPNSPPMELLVHFSATGTLRIMANSAHATRAPNTIVRGALTDLVAALFQDDLPRGISIEGDERLLQALQHSLRNLAPAWRTPLDALVARLAGDRSGQTPPGAPLLADLLGQAELAFATLRTTVTDTLNNTRERAEQASGSYWAREPDLDAFATRLEDLQLEVDRLNARLGHLSSNALGDKQ